MKSAFFKLVLSAIAATWTLCAQVQPTGIAPDWDIRVILKEISAHATRLLPLLDQIDPRTWTSQGAPDTYVAQLNSSKAQARALADEAIELSKQPEKLSKALETYFRMQSVEYMLASLSQGIRRYQNPALADLLNGVVAENGANRDRFQRYIVDLAAEREQEYQVMDHEAQRCRGFLSRQPVAVPGKSERKK